MQPTWLFWTVASQDPRYVFVQRRYLRRRGDLQQLSPSIEPDAILHLAAESHVDRSIDAPEVFVQTNVVGTLRIASGGAATIGRSLPPDAQSQFRFHACLH